MSEWYNEIEKLDERLSNLESEFNKIRETSNDKYVSEVPVYAKKDIQLMNGNIIKKYQKVYITSYDFSSQMSVKFNSDYIGTIWKHTGSDYFWTVDEFVKYIQKNYNKFWYVKNDCCHSVLGTNYDKMIAAGWTFEEMSTPLCSKPTIKQVTDEKLTEIIENLQSVIVDAGGRFFKQSELKNMKFEELVRQLVPNDIEFKIELNRK